LLLGEKKSLGIRKQESLEKQDWGHKKIWHRGNSGLFMKEGVGERSNGREQFSEKESCEKRVC